MTISEEVITSSVISLNELFSNSTTQFIKPFEEVVDPDIHKGMYLDFKLCDRKQKDKVGPILRLAKPEDAQEIVGIYRELYNGTYPYKEMEDVDEVRKMIQEPSIQWIIYQDPSYNIAGCITFVLDFDNKRGYIRGFMLKKKYQGYIDITKAMIGSMLGMIHKYKDVIFLWYVENRTAHAKSQYSMWVCGIAPIGFYPNKDVFLGRVESDLMQICYDERALRTLRMSTVPSILPQVESCFLYSDNRYKLGDYNIETPGIILDQKKINYLKKCLIRSSEIDDFGYETIQFRFPDTSSYFEFLYTPQVQNFEKTKYRVNSLEELYVFVEEFINCGKERGIRYCEVFLSACEPTHQKIFLNAGLSPRGYIPSWNYNTQKGVFEDNILFNWYEGNLDKDIHLIDEGKKLLKTLALGNSSVSKKILERIPLFYSVKDKILNVWNYPKIIKSSLMTGLIVYLFMLIGSIIIAKFFGYTLISHYISQLGSLTTTPVPFMFDCACVIGGLTTMLLYCFLSRRISTDKNRVMDKIRRYATISGVIGSTGIILIGIFSSDRSGPRGIFHNLSMIFAFGGFILALFAYGMMISRNSSKIQKIIGINGILPMIILIWICIFPSPLLEWILLFSIIESLIPFFCWVSFR